MKLNIKNKQTNKDIIKTQNNIQTDEKKSETVLRKLSEIVQRPVKQLK